MMSLIAICTLAVLFLAAWLVVWFYEQGSHASRDHKRHIPKTERFCQATMELLHLPTSRIKQLKENEEDPDSPDDSKASR